MKEKKTISNRTDGSERKKEHTYTNNNNNNNKEHEIAMRERTEKKTNRKRNANTSVAFQIFQIETKINGKNNRTEGKIFHNLNNKQMENGNK